MKKYDISIDAEVVPKYPKNRLNHRVPLWMLDNRPRRTGCLEARGKRYVRYIHAKTFQSKNDYK